MVYTPFRDLVERNAGMHGNGAKRWLFFSLSDASCWARELAGWFGSLRDRASLALFAGRSSQQRKNTNE